MTREHRGQRAERGAGVAEEELGLLDRETRRRRRARAREPSAFVAASRRRARAARRACRACRRNRARRARASRRRASAASSSVRLEMLFEPGSRTRAAHARDRARARGAHRSARLSRLLQQPARARASRARSNIVVERRRRRRSRSRCARISSSFDVVVEQREQRVAVGDADVAPHLRASCRRCARCRASRRRSSRSSSAASLALREHAHQREREDVRQMAHRGEDLVVPARRRARTMRAPHASHAPRTSRTRRRLGLRLRREDHVAVAEELGERGARAALLRARRSDARARSARSARRGSVSRTRSRPAWCCRRR